MLSTKFGCGSQQASRVLRLQPEIGGMFADCMDIYSLTMWRLTCQSNYDQAVSSLRRSLLKMLEVFVPTPVAVLNIVTRHRCVFGGEFALAFILRDPSILSCHLDIYSADRDFDPLCSYLIGAAEFQGMVTAHEYLELGALDALRTLECQILQVTTCLGKTIRVHRSYTSSATAPISHASCTALSNFVTEFGFGCSHPSLTLRRLALVADQELPHVPPTDYEVHDRLMRLGVSFAFSPIAWSEFRGTVDSDGTTNPPESSGVAGDGPSVANTSPGPTLLDQRGCDLQCGSANPCESCLCAVSPAPVPLAIPFPAPPSSSYRGPDDPSLSESRDVAPQPPPYTATHPTAQASPSSGVVDPSVPVHSNAADALDLDIIVGPAHYHYVGLDDVAPAHGISTWDLVPVSSIERPLYLGEIVYSGVSRSVEHVSEASCAEKPVSQRVDTLREDHSLESIKTTVGSQPLRPGSALSHFPTIASHSLSMVKVGSSPPRSGSSPSDLMADPCLDEEHVALSPTSSSPLIADGLHHDLSQRVSASSKSSFSAITDTHTVSSSPSKSAIPPSVSIAFEPPTATAGDSDDRTDSDDTEYSTSHDGTDTVIEIPGPEKCFRHLYLCPSQGRFFGDCGSFVDFFDPLQGGEAICSRRGIAPFGPVVIWRVLSTFNCEKGCDLYDDAFDVGVGPTPVVLKPNLLHADSDVD